MSYLTVKQHIGKSTCCEFPLFLPLIRIQTSHSGQDHLRRRPQFFVALQWSGLLLCCFLFGRKDSNYLSSEFEICFSQGLIQWEFSAYVQVPDFTTGGQSCQGFYLCQRRKANFPDTNLLLVFRNVCTIKTPHTGTLSIADLTNLTSTYYLHREIIMTLIYWELKQHTDTDIQTSHDNVWCCQHWYNDSLIVLLCRAWFHQRTSDWSTSPNPSHP